MSDLALEAAELERVRTEAEVIHARHTGRPLEEVVADVGRDRWFDADAALDYGFVDAVVTSLDQVLPRRAVRRIGIAS